MELLILQYLKKSILWNLLEFLQFLKSFLSIKYQKQIHISKVIKTAP